jgi:two-component system, chemotaxis family, protein-glutamate methylesterase/glutaminase
MGAVPLPRGAVAAPAPRRICRVMVVDDSAVIRGLVARALAEDPEIEVVASVANGQLAVDVLRRRPVDVVVLDVEMPVMDGLTALPRLLEAAPGVKVIMVSTLTQRGASVTVRALAQGAADYLTKPGASAQLSAAEFRAELVAKVKAWAGSRRRPPCTTETTTPVAAVPSLALRPLPRRTPRALAIGSSTGGPQALFTLFGALGGELRVPVFVTQHMPATFTAILAEHLARVSGVPCGEARDGEPVADGRIYLAPGDHHLVVESGGRLPRVRTLRTPPEHFCRPAVDPMLRSLAEVYGDGLLAVILTGMGQDGLLGGEATVAAGGAVVAQDEASSVVWGMPGAVARRGLCSAVLPLSRIAPFILERFGSGGR